MANKKRSKKRKGTSQRQQQPNQQGTMSSVSNDDTVSVEQDGHTSDGGISSDMQDSEGAHTEMTSIMSSESLIDALEPEGSDDGHGALDGQSVYAASQYPRVAESHRTETPYFSALPIYDTDMSSTRSFMERELDYHYEHGRRYCGSYHLPNDEWEQYRMSVIHRVYLHVFENNLSTTPLQNPTRILDLGTGIGEWAIGMADTWPNCEVIGTDISAIAPTSVPANCFFEVDDAELEWERELDSFDLVHLRNMMGSFTDWSFIYKEAFKVLKPGGWLELLDFDDQAGFMKFLAEFPPQSDMHILARDLAIAAVKSGRPRGIAHLNPRLLIEAGFVDIKVTEHIIPINVDASGGKLWLIACIDGLEAACLRPLTKYMGWDPDKVKESCYEVAKEMARIAKDPVKSKGLNIKARVLVGKKPLVPGQWNAQSFNEDAQMREDQTNGEDHAKLQDGNGAAGDEATMGGDNSEAANGLTSNEDHSTFQNGNRRAHEDMYDEVVSGEGDMEDTEDTKMSVDLVDNRDYPTLQNEKTETQEPLSEEATSDTEGVRRADRTDSETPSISYDGNVAAQEVIPGSPRPVVI